jgi:hypothetical protein
MLGAPGGPAAAGVRAEYQGRSGLQGPVCGRALDINSPEGVHRSVCGPEEGGGAAGS